MPVVMVRPKRAKGDELMVRLFVSRSGVSSPASCCCYCSFDNNCEISGAASSRSSISLLPDASAFAFTSS